MRISTYASLIAFGLAALPVITVASCVPGARPSYQDISAVYFRSEGVTEPVAIDRGDPVQPGDCPVAVALYVSPSDVEKVGGPACFKSSAGKVYSCCGATTSDTNDSPQTIFGRLVAALEKDQFCNIVDSPHVDSPQLTESDGAAFYSIAVMRCGAWPHRGSILSVRSPKAQPNTSILALSIPFGSLPEVAYDSRIITLVADFTRAIYQSQWIPGDIY